MPKVTSRNVYADTTFHLVTIKDGRLELRTFPNVGQKARGTEFINGTKGVSGGDYVLIGPQSDLSAYDIEPTVITDIEEQRRRVFDHLVEKYPTFKPGDADL